MNNEKTMNLAADNIRILAASMVEKAKSGHPGGSMGGADFINTLYSEFLNFNPDQPDYPYRDRFFLDPGHMSPMLYSTLALAGLLPLKELENFRQWESMTPGHPEVDVLHGIENTSGPLGQGHAMALGAAIAERFMAARFGEWMAHKTYAYISDGGVQEEISQGVGRIAGHLGLNHLILYYDSNNIQLSTKVDEVNSENVAAKYMAWNWNVITVDGSSADEIRRALKEANAEKERPTIIIGKTVMAKGAVDANGASYENTIATHGQPLSAAGADFNATIKNLGGDPENPFAIFPKVEALYAGRRNELKKWAQEMAREEEKFRAGNTELAVKLDLFLSGKMPEIDYTEAAFKMKFDISTRAASAMMLSFYAERVENMIVASADLSNSDKTDGFLKHTRAIRKGDYSGQFLQAGVSELTMACIMNGMALHGGVIPVCGTFFVFSDYMKPAVRLAALMRLHVIYVWTHDSFRVGEDGPTHQPVEHEAQLRLLEHLRNHKGERSMVVIRPSDAHETVYAWQVATESARPAALVLSRQNITTLPALSGYRYKEAQQLVKGGYIIGGAWRDPDVILLGNGSEVATLVEAYVRITQNGIRPRIVSIPSEGIFRDQDPEYQKSVLPDGVKRFGLTSGLPVTLQGLVGEDGYIHGMPSFGYSAPYQVLDQKLGFTGENVCRLVVKMLKG
jgi:transketolase